MTDDRAKPSDYIHGSSPDEQRRLSLMNTILNDACIRELAPQPGERVLDFGSGLGQFTRLIARTTQAEAIGIERDPQQIARAIRLAEDAGEAMLVDYREGDVLDPPLTASEWGSFDLAVARFLLEHMPEPALVIEQMVRSLRPGGRVFIIDDDHGAFRPWPEPEGFEALWRAYVRSFECLGNDPHIGRRLVSLLHEGGLVSLRNSCVFFGGAAGSEGFRAIADNLIAAIGGAESVILENGLLDEAAVAAGLEGLSHWKAQPSSALWYAACAAEGIVPDRA